MTSELPAALQHLALHAALASLWSEIDYESGHGSKTRGEACATASALLGVPNDDRLERALTWVAFGLEST